MAVAEKNLGQSVVFLRCKVSSLPSQMPADFEKEFCQALASNLSRDLSTPFQLTAEEGWRGEGAAVVVDVRMASTNRAEVTISPGRAEEGAFKANSSTTTSLTSIDRPLSPASSRTLVRGIGLVLGIID